MGLKNNFSEAELAALAKQFRMAAGKNRAQASRELDVSNPSLFHAEETPTKSLSKLRIQIIEKYSSYRVEGPMYVLKRR